MESTKERIKNTALDLFAKEGYAGSSIRNIAKIVGIRESAIYNHYGSKEEIIEAIFIDFKKNSESTGLLTDELLDEIENPYKFISDFCEKLLRFWDTPKQKKLIRLLMVEEFRDYKIDKLSLNDLIEDLRKIWEMIFAEITKYGLIKSFDTKVLANEFIAPLFFIRLQFLTDENRDGLNNAIKETKKHVNFFWNAIDSDKKL